MENKVTLDSIYKIVGQLFVESHLQIEGLQKENARLQVEKEQLLRLVKNESPTEGKTS